MHHYSILIIGIIIFASHYFIGLFNRTKIPDVLLLIVLGVSFRIISIFFKIDIYPLQETAENIRAQADKKRTVIIAEAYRTAEKERGLGDAKSTAIYADAYGRDAEFYAFTRSLKAYVNSFTNKSDMLVIDPDSEFFEYFKNIKE